MSIFPALDLSAIDGIRVDGLEFCARVYRLFDVGAGPHTTHAGFKRYVEELLPLTRFIQRKYSVNWRIAIEWHSGSQPWDARLYNSGPMVDQGLVPATFYLEITTAGHPHEFLEDLEVPAHDHAPDLSASLLNALALKSTKHYPPDTILLINVETTNPLRQSTWDKSIALTRAHLPTHTFHSIYVTDIHGHFWSHL